MARSKTTTRARSQVSERPAPRSLKLSEQGITTAQDFANIMGALMTDLISGRVTPQVGNAMCNAGGKLLKVVEMQMKYGSPSNSAPSKRVLVLAGDSNSPLQSDVTDAALKSAA